MALDRHDNGTGDPSYLPPIVSGSPPASSFLLPVPILPTL
nr:hypothetical protein [Aeromonas veronii]